MNAEEYRNLVGNLAAEGFEPAYVGSDASLATDFPCEACPSVCHYEGFQRGSEYRWFTVCDNCGHVFESTEVTAKTN